MSDNFLAIPDEVQCSASPFVKAEFFLQDAQSENDVILPSVTVQDIDAMNFPDDVTTIHEHTIESGQVPLTDFRGLLVRTRPTEVQKAKPAPERVEPKRATEVTETPQTVVAEEEGEVDTQQAKKNKPNVTVRTQLKHKTKAIKLDNIKHSIKESIKKTLSDPAATTKKTTPTLERNRFVKSLTGVALCMSVRECQ